MNLSEITNIVFEDIDFSDYPDYCDAFIFSADIAGEPMTEDELNELNENKDFVYRKLMEHLY